jgi:hypothetical protein
MTAPRAGAIRHRAGISRHVPPEPPDAGICDSSRPQASTREMWHLPRYLGTGKPFTR